MKKSGFIPRIIAAVLVVCVILSGAGITRLSYAAEKDKELGTQYVKEVKMFYAGSAEEGRKICEAEGFVFCPENLKEYSNSKVNAYLGYKTTENEGDAITDITLLDMKNSHYSEEKYEDFLDENIGQFADAAAHRCGGLHLQVCVFCAGADGFFQQFGGLGLFAQAAGSNERHVRIREQLLYLFVLQGAAVQADFCHFHRFQDFQNLLIVFILNANANHPLLLLRSFQPLPPGPGSQAGSI